MPRFTENSRPITDLIKKGLDSKWRKGQSDTFCQLKTYLSTRETLALYDPKLQHEVHTDEGAVDLVGILI